MNSKPSDYQRAINYISYQNTKLNVTANIRQLNNNYRVIPTHAIFFSTVIKYLYIFLLKWDHLEFSQRWQSINVNFTNYVQSKHIKVKSRVLYTYS